MKLLKFFPSVLIIEGRCVYRTEDMVLEYEKSVPPSDNPGQPLLIDVINQELNLDRPTELLLIADTLTLTFGGLDFHLSGFDAYTNKQIWDVSPFHRVPEIKGQGLLLADPTSFVSDRRSLGFKPKYEIAANGQWVRIVLSGGNSEFYYEVASNLVVGLKNEMITDMYLLNVTFL